jgi:hypothetical protein
MKCRPARKGADAASYVIVHCATRATIGTAVHPGSGVCVPPNDVASVKLTVPVGELPVTVAVYVTGEKSSTVAALVVTTTVAPDWFTVTPPASVPVLVAFAASPE